MLIIKASVCSFLLLIFFVFTFLLVFFDNLLQAQTAYEHMKTLMAVVIYVSVVAAVVLGKNQYALCIYFIIVFNK